MKMDSYAIRGNQSNRIKSTQAIAAVEKAMKRYGVPKPPKGQRSRLHHDLPSTPEEKEAEVLRRFKYSNLHSKAVNEIAQKLNDLLVYAETGKSLKSDLIALAVINKLESFEKEVQESQKMVLVTQKDLLSRRNFSQEFTEQILKRQRAIQKRGRKVVDDLKIYEDKGFLRRLALPITIHTNLFANSAKPIERPRQFLKSSSWRNLNLYAVNISEKVREDIDKYKQIGTVKKQLFSMPQYFRDREIKGIKLPENKLKSPTKDLDNNIKIESVDADVIKVRKDVETKMRRVVAMENAERKKMESLKQKLNPIRVQYNTPVLP